MAEKSPIRVLLVDDEPLGRQRVADLLAKEKGVEIVGTAGSGDAAVEAIRNLDPDLVFLDVQMPGKTGLEVFNEVGPANMPPTVFVTAYDQHALRAFELAALDYLVKPFDDERFEQALLRARRQVELEQIGELRDQLLALLRGDDSSAAERASPAADAAAAQSGEASATPAPAGLDRGGGRYIERIAVESRGKVRVVNVADIDFIVASGPYAELYVGDRRHLIREPMHSLEEKLDPAKFLRIHRSIIVRIDLVETLHRGAGGDYEVELKGGRRLRVSRSRREELERRLGVTH
jgi:two-component system LytT family response regulator